MCSVTHVAVGALIGSLVNNHLAAFGLGFASHLPLDVIPHFDFKDYRVDALITVAMLGGLLLAVGFSPVLLGALGAVVPDFENLLWKIGIINERRKVFPTHSGLIEHGRALAGGMPAEIAVSAFSVAAAVLAVVLRGMLRGGIS
jgi:hypothetical protein